jgi:tRNA(Arg) A34 adenosine deaminase TadA
MTVDEQFMNEAIKEAELAASESNWPMGCVLNQSFILKSLEES